MLLAKIMHALGFGNAFARTSQSENPNPVEKPNSPMDEDKFWFIIAATTKKKRDQEQQCEMLRSQLENLAPTEIASFELRFEELKSRIYNWDMWGATYVVHGGASDDAFEYFMRWLVSRGRGDFERVSKNPDELGAIISKVQTEPCEFEEFGYVASQVWQSKTGIDPWQDVSGAFPYSGAPPASEVSGVEFEDSEEALSKRYPKLWSRFGNDPL